MIPTASLTAPGRGRARALLVLGAVLLLAALLMAVGANPAVSQTTELYVRRVDGGPGVDPGAGVWDRVPGIDVALTAQETTYPFGGGSVSTVQAQALYDDSTLYLRLSWDDAFRDDRTDAPEAFADAAAVEFPADAAATVPSVCMGQAAGGVNIWQWRADSQAGVPQSSGDLGNGTADVEPPADDPVHFPARNAGNPYAQPEAGAMQNLVATGFGTLEPAAEQVLAGEGEYGDGGWSVVFSRTLPSPGAGQPLFTSETTVDVAFAVWDGHAGDRNGKKSVSQFVKLEFGNEGVPGPNRAGLWIVAGVLAVGIVGRLILPKSPVRRREEPAA